MATRYYFCAFVRDITERKRLEAALRGMNQELEQRVDERTAQLAAANQELRETEEQIRNSLREKEVLLREVHHRVKNNLAVISSMFYLQSTSSPDEQVTRILQKNQERVRSIALVHESLYRSDTLAEVNFGEYVQSLTDQIFRTYRLPSRQVSLRTEIDPLLLSIETAIPCGLILNELVTNSLKHAFPGDKPGDVRLRLRRRADGRCVLSVADNGVGNPQDLDVQTTRSLGLRLVRALSRQLDGTMQIERTNPGTDAQLTFFIKNGHKRLMP